LYAPAFVSRLRPEVRLENVYLDVKSNQWYARGGLTIESLGSNVFWIRMRNAHEDYGARMTRVYLRCSGRTFLGAEFRSQAQKERKEEKRIYFLVGTYLRFRTCVGCWNQLRQLQLRAPGFESQENRLFIREHYADMLR